MNQTLTTIARIYTDFPQKFGLPRQSGLVQELPGTIVFEQAFRDPEAVRGIEGFDYLWLLWGFDVPRTNEFRPTVRPPRLGGNERMGVFSTRSPFRPNAIGLSSVRLTGVETTAEHGPVLHVQGIDMRNETPIYDIKPYLAYTDSHEGARSGFTDSRTPSLLTVDFPEKLLSILPNDKRAGALAVLRNDIRPSYHGSRKNADGREYGLSYAGYNIRFRVYEDRLTVLSVEAES